MFNVLGGVLLFAAVCGIGLLLAFVAHYQMKRNTDTRYMLHSDPYLQYVQDKQVLNGIGYAQQLRRIWSSFGTFSVSFTTMSVLAGAALYFGPAYSQAGAWAFSIAWPIVSLFAIVVAAAVAELSSMMPSSGGGYHWSLVYGGRRWAWMAAWLRGMGDLGLLLIVNGALSRLLDRIFSEHLGYERGLTSFVLLAVLIFGSQCMLAWRGRAWLSRLTRVGAWIQVGLIVLIVGGLAWTIGPKLQPAEYLFAFGPGGTGQGGWLQMILAMLLMQRLYLGGDASAHAVEEAKNPQVNVPWSIYLTSVYGFVFGYVLLAFVALSTTGAISLHSAGGNVFLLLTSNVWGAWNGLMNGVIAAGVFAALWYSGLGLTNSSARLWFAYHRDGNSKFSGWLTLVNLKTQTPHRIVFAVTVLGFTALMLCTVAQVWNFMETVNLFWFLTAWSLICTNTALAIPLGLLLHSDSRSYTQIAWHMGKLAWPLRRIAFIWLLVTALAALLFMSAYAGIAAVLVLMMGALLHLLAVRLLGSNVPAKRTPSREELLQLERLYKSY